VGLQTLENKALSRGIIGKSAPILAEITIRKSQDDTYNMARTNVLNTQTPKFRNLLSEWWQVTEEQTDGRETQRTQTPGEAGTGKPEA
jgi:hypothetical protein